MATFGIDISRWQKGLSLAQAQKEGVQFAILKAGGSDSGHYKDACFESFYLQAKALGMPVGAYYFGRDLTVGQAEASAEHFIELLSGKQFEYPVYYDVEGAMLTKTTKAELTAIVNAFCSRLESAGYWVGVYSQLSGFNSEMDISHYCRWVAAWRKTKPEGADMWQFGGETNVIRSNKICGRVVDQDYCYKDYPSLIKAKGLNGWKTASKQVVKMQIAKPVISAGSTGANAKLLQVNLNVFGAKLKEDGVFGAKSVKALKAWQKNNGLVSDGVYGVKSHAVMKKLIER